MKRSALLKILENASAEVSEVDAPCHPPEIPAWVRGLRFEEIVSADQAIEVFLETKRWPALKNSIRAQLQMRLESAQDFLKNVPDDPSYRALLERDVLEMLLLQMWYRDGIAWTDRKYGMNN